MNSWLFVILLIIILSYTLDATVGFLNIKALKTDIPKEFSDLYEEDEYAKSQSYTRATTSFSLVQNSITTFILVVFIVCGGFNSIDLWARQFGFEEIGTGIIFIGALTALSSLMSLPFTIYSTFVIEEKFGFNRTTIKTFLGDLLKALLLSILLGGPLLVLILWFFINTGDRGWVYCWIGIVGFTLIIQFIAPVLIMPLFNKFFPLQDGTLHDHIQDYARRENFQIQGIFTMDGSKRSSKLNAFFTGFGRFRKIVFFDTLVEKLSTDEIVAVLAHEMGHFKLHHIPQMMLASVVQTGIMLYLLSHFLGNDSIATAFAMESSSIYSSLVFFGFLYTPISLFISILFNYISRKNEFAADSYATHSTGHSKFLISGLKKLSKENLSNLTPHPMLVFLHYSHPPLVERIDMIQKSNGR